jgi:hypothetical protein
MPFEKLHFALVFLRRRERIERAQIAPLTRFRIHFARIKAIVAGFQFANHNYCYSADIQSRASFCTRDDSSEPRRIFMVVARSMRRCARVRVRAALRAADERLLALLRFAALRVCREIARVEVAPRPSCFNAPGVARERRREIVRDPYCLRSIVSRSGIISFPVGMPGHPAAQQAALPIFFQAASRSSWIPSLNSSIIFLLNSGRSSGRRLVTRP